MSTPLTDRKSQGSSGFTLLEVMIALVIIAVGILALAALISKTGTGTDRSRYMSTASLLASEKLEELSRLPADDPAINIATGTTVGSLTANTGPVLVGGSSISYFDQVFLSSGVDATCATGTACGAVAVTTTKTDGTGYLTQTQTPDAGTKAGNPSLTPPSATADMLIFQRRWLVENDVPGFPVGVRRVTVLVTLVNGAMLPPVNFKMSMVRQ